jgi:hypothetical protein
MLAMITITRWRCDMRVDKSALMDDKDAAMTTNHQSTAHKIRTTKVVMVTVAAHR